MFNNDNINNDISKSIRSFFKTGKTADLANTINIHFIGCGGIGMCGLAVLCKQFGFDVSGSDIKESQNTKFLTQNDIKLYIHHSTDNIPENPCSIIVYSSAVDKDNIEFRTAIEKEIPCYRRGEFLAFISTHYKTVVSIAGSHGKTTVTSMLVNILTETAIPKLGYLIGGWPVDKNTLCSVGDGKLFVIEADESDLSLTLLKSDVGVILNIDDDHSWNVGGNKSLLDGFKTFVNKSNTAVYADANINKLIGSTSQKQFIIDFKNNVMQKTEYIYGEYQLKNATTALFIASKLGIEKLAAENSLKYFKGVKRRMQKVFSNTRFSIYEDYAHHPSEVNAALKAIIKKYPDKFLTLVFQPHRFARLKYYLNRFSVELKPADKIFIVPTFSAWSDKEDISEDTLAAAIGNNAESLKGSWEKIAQTIYHKLPDKKGIILILGAGDVNSLINKIIKLEENISKIN